ncbi:hypothetical protein B0A49_11421, partial [Cryomyces minteri]
MPQIHLGVYLTSGNETVQAVKWALEAGYRAIDSAQMYHNEGECGRAINDCLSSKANAENLKREDIHFTSKLASNAAYDVVRKSIKGSVKKSGMGYIDLFLLHSPYGGRKARLESWKAVEDAIDDGEIRIGGVSNFGVKHLEELLAAKPRIKPAVNQVEVHPFNTRTNITSFCQRHDIVVEAYAPLARALRMKHPAIVHLAKKYKCTPVRPIRIDSGSTPGVTGCTEILNQSGLDGLLTTLFVPLPKSVKEERIIENGAIGGFEISGEDMIAMDGLDEYLVTDWDPVD